MKINFLSLLWPLNVASSLKGMRAKDLPYSSGPRYKLDIYTQKRREQKKPIIIFWHGGSWTYGDKKHYRFVGDYIKSLGSVCVVVNYPLFPKQTFPGFIDDAFLAVSWVKENIAEYGGDPTKIYLMGHSSGGHIALITALKLQKHIRGCIAVAAPSKISRRVYGEVFGQAFETGAEKPSHYIKPKKYDTRFLLIHGKLDKIVSASDAEEICHELIENGFKSEVIKPFMGHMRIVSTIGWPLAPFYKEGKRIKEFINS